VSASTGTADDGTYDVVILGGGLAGLTLALQLKRQRPVTSIFVAEKRAGPAPEAAFKVGESTVEIAADYFTRICGLADHIESDQLVKAGLRFFFPAGDNSDITQRVEWGDTAFAPVSTYQLDRGRFENELARRCLEHGVELRDGCRVEEVTLGPDVHTVETSSAGERRSVTGRWVVDCAGRAFILKAKLGLEKDVSHAVNSSWFRVGGGLVDLEEWGAHDAAWMGRMEQPGIRKHSTNHLTGEGYWVWLIPLASGSHSIGIVADPRFHPYERISTQDAAFAWLHEHEPQLARVLETRRGDVQDFLRIEHFSHSCRRVFSPERWCLTGESGVFVDPLYSPGSDYIAFANIYAGDLIKRDLDGEDVSERAERYNAAFLMAFENFLAAIWEDHYAYFGDAEVFTAKLTWDYVGYWGIQALRMYNDRLCDMEFTVAIQPHLRRVGELLPRVEQLFRDWHALGQPPNPTGLHAVPSSFHGLWDRLKELHATFDEETLRSRYETTADLHEAMAVMLLHKAAARLPQGPPDAGRRINPYAVSLSPERWEADGLFDDAGLTLEEAWERSLGFENMLLDELARRAPSVSA
jgi:flavin-dependent dehydrogenase